MFYVVAIEVSLYFTLQYMK